METLCELSDVSMLYGTQQALSRVNISVRRGEIVGLLGANGAGKSTLLEIIEGLKQPSAGQVSLLGRSPDSLDHHERSQIGFMFQRYALPGYIGVRELLDLYGSLYPEDDGEALSTRLGLRGLLGKRIGQLSAGQQQRLAFLCAIYGQRSLLVLDEPTSALDIRSRRAMKELLTERKRSHNLGVLLSTHEMSDAAELCDRIYIIDRGEIKLDASADQLLRRSRGRLRVECHAPESVLRPLCEAMGNNAGPLENLPRSRWRIECDGSVAAEFLRSLLDAELEHGFLSGVHISSARLEDIYLETVSHDD